MELLDRLSAAPQLRLMSVEEYLEAELDGEVRHEYVGGYTYAMEGAKNCHNDIVASFLFSLYSQLRGNQCRPYNSDTKVRIHVGGYTRFYYPDGMVVCKPNLPSETFQDNPVVIAEVISESTRRTDEGEKRDAYLTIPSLMTYLLIESELPRVAVYQRTGDDFVNQEYEGLDSVVPLEAINASRRLAELYENINFA